VRQPSLDKEKRSPGSPSLSGLFPAGPAVAFTEGDQEEHAGTRKPTLACSTSMLAGFASLAPDGCGKIL
jgi:hypothetical protein